MALDFIERKGSELQLKTLEKEVKNKFKWSWLEERDELGNFFSAYIRKIKAPGVVWCTVCCDKINYGSSGKKALTNHAKRSSHQKNHKLATQKSQQALPAMFQAVKAMADGTATKSSPLPYGSPANVEESFTRINNLVAEQPPRPVSMKDRISNQEALIISFIAELALPMRIAPRLISLAQELSKDPKALSELSLSRATVAYKLQEGVSKLFHKRLVSAMKSTPFSINIDETTVKSNKNRVLNILVCYFCDKLGKCVTHLYASIQMTVVNAQSVYDAVVGKLKEDDIPLLNLVSVLSDSAAYMRGKKNGFQEKLKTEVPYLIDIDGDVCHHVHNIVKDFCSKIDPDQYLEKMLGDLHRDFTFSADLRDDLKHISTLLSLPALQPTEFVGHRWLSIFDSTTRFLAILNQLTIFYFAWLPVSEKHKFSGLVTDIMKSTNISAGNRALVFATLRRLKAKNLTHLGKARKMRIVNKLFQTRTQTLLLSHTTKAVLPMMKEFVLIFEQNSPQIHKLHDTLMSTYKHFLACFVRPEIITQGEIMQLSINEEKCLPANHIFVGNETEAVLKKTDPDSRKSFRETVKKAYMGTASYMQRKLPLDNPVLISLSALDPIARGHTATLVHLKKLCTLCRIPVTHDMEMQMRNYQISSNLPPADTTTHLDIWWGQVLLQYPSLSPLIKTCLSIFTGPRVEQSFSGMNVIVDSSANRMTVKTCEAYQKIKYVLLAQNKTSEQLFSRSDILYDPVDSSIVYHLQTAYSRWKLISATPPETKKTPKQSLYEVADNQRQEILHNAEKRKGSPLKGLFLKYHK